MLLDTGDVVFIINITIVAVVWQEFRWQPIVNESMLDVYKAWLSMATERRPKLIITGGATVS